MFTFTGPRGMRCAIGRLWSALVWLSLVLLLVSKSATAQPNNQDIDEQFWQLTTQNNLQINQQIQMLGVEVGPQDYYNPHFQTPDILHDQYQELLNQVSKF